MTAPRPAATPAVPAAPLPAAQVRVGDADRNRTAALLAEAGGAGLLQFDEVEERLAKVYAARTAGDLAPLTLDLPPEWLTARSRAERLERDRAAARAGLSAHLRSYFAVMALLVGIWLSVAVTAGAWYPWPIWPALGWGIGVWSHVRAARGSAGTLGGCHRLRSEPTGG